MRAICCMLEHFVCTFLAKEKKKWQMETHECNNQHVLDFFFMLFCVNSKVIGGSSSRGRSISSLHTGHRTVWGRNSRLTVCASAVTGSCLAWVIKVWRRAVCGQMTVRHMAEKVTGLPLALPDWLIVNTGYVFGRCLVWPFLSSLSFCILPHLAFKAATGSLQNVVMCGAALQISDRLRPGALPFILKMHKLMISLRETLRNFKTPAEKYGGSFLCQTLLFCICRSHDIHKESRDMGWYVWTEEWTEIFLGIIGDKGKHCNIRLETAENRSWNEGKGLPEDVANIPLKIKGRSATEGPTGKQKPPRKRQHWDDSECCCWNVNKPANTTTTAHFFFLVT